MIFMECVGVFYVNILCMTEFVCIFLSLYTDDGMWHADGNTRSGIKQTNCMLLRIPRVEIPQRFEIQRNFHVVKRQ
ncbi:MAG: hypothetical protein DBY24_04290 [Prevotellaceae bacterium]|nr:MAG: hypothetical protein DBY24_04290 [Prevotellaceae bacterium]